MSEQIEEMIKSITKNEGVEGFVIVNSEGIPIRSNLDNDSKVKYASLMTQLISKARSTVAKLDGSQLTFFRMRTKFHEVLVAPAQDLDYLLIVLQKTSDQKTQQPQPEQH